VQHTDAVTVEFYFPDDDKPLFEPYQIYGPDSDIPFQTGRINAIGEVSFRPDRPGNWRVQVNTSDGHDIQVQVQTDGILDIESAHAQTEGQGVWAQVQVNETPEIDAIGTHDVGTNNADVRGGYGTSNLPVPEIIADSANIEAHDRETLDTIKGMIMTERTSREISDTLVFLWSFLLVLILIFGAVFQALSRWNTQTALSRLKGGPA